MADSNLTKRALAHGLKQMVAAQPFEKVNVRDLCGICGVSRKTFYYHFRDKYELAEWIFNTEFISVLNEAEMEDRWLFVSAVCRYFHRERTFYSALLRFEGQNSFREYFQKFMFQTLEPFLRRNPEKVEAENCDGIPPAAVQEFYSHFVSDSIILAIFRWLTDGAELPPEQFVSLMKGVEKLLVRTSNDSGGGEDGLQQEDSAVFSENEEG